MPNIQALDVKGGRDPEDLVRVCDRGVLPTGLGRIFWHDVSTHDRALIDAEPKPLEHPELHQMYMDGVRINRPIPELPDLGRALRGVRDDRVLPHDRDRRVCAAVDAQQHGRRTEGNDVSVSGGVGARTIHRRHKLVPDTPGFRGTDEFRNRLEQREVPRRRVLGIFVAIELQLVGRILCVRKFQFQKFRRGGFLADGEVVVNDVELHHLTSRVLVRRLKVARVKASKGSVGPGIDQAHHLPLEVENHIGTLSRAEEQRLPSIVGLRVGRLRPIAGQHRLEARSHANHFRQEALVSSDYEEVELLTQRRPGRRIQRAVVTAGIHDAEG
mmetsp:Transcript_28525/g.74246  ORF Transcript_28525/g.74246 Transcript_28525/m.74246 type:complete len:328 (-) Transcript_28525:1374-2357(-)